MSVIIVGAGLAGLSAACELERRGHRVVLLEADGRHVGGRVRTLRFADGLYGEAGAMRVPVRHEVTRHFLRELGVPLRKFVHSNPQAYYYVRGERRRFAEVRGLSAFAWFNPGQHSNLHRHIVAPEGRVYFAGEHASLTHTWMQGALESSQRAVTELLAAAQTG